MNDTFDTALRRRFAQLPPPEEGAFVAATLAQLRRRRRARELLQLSSLLAGLIVVGLLTPRVAAWAAALAPAAQRLATDAIVAAQSLPGLMLLFALAFTACVVLWTTRRV